MRSAAAFLLGLAITTASCGSAHAISTLEDVLRNAPRLFRSPSGMPPNNALHRGAAARRTPIIPRDVDPLNPDEGPGGDQPLVSVPAASVPWLVAIADTENLEQDFLCAGLLVDAKWVLTAAHCLFLTERRWPHDSRPRVFIGSTSFASPGRSFPIEEIVIHPEYSSITLRSDVALVKIDPGSHAVTPVPLEGPPVREHVGDVGTVLGYGSTTTTPGQPRRGRPKLIQIAIVDYDVCFSRINYEVLRETGVYCGRPLLKHHDICHRFSGSPMILYGRGGLPYPVGLVTWNTVCPLPEGQLNVFQDVQTKVPWIRAVIGAAQQGERR
jgi:secreted trypsin-like serine protease